MPNTKFYNKKNFVLGLNKYRSRKVIKIRIFFKKYCKEVILYK